MIYQSPLAGAGRVARMPLTLRWPDPDHRLRLQIGVQLLQRIDSIVGPRPVDAVGLLLGLRTSPPRTANLIDDVVLLARQPGGTLPPSHEVQRQISHWTRAAGNQVSAVGLFLVQAAGMPIPPQAKDLLSISQYFADSVPIIVLSSADGVLSASLYIWLPAAARIYLTALKFPVNIETLIERSFIPFIPEYERHGYEELGQQTTPVFLRDGGNVSRSPTFPSLRSHAALSWVLLTLTVTVLVFGLHFVFNRLSYEPLVRHTPAEALVRERPQGDLGLDVTRSGTDFRIRWDRTSPLLHAASAGGIRIQDKDQLVEVPLNPQQLLDGQVLYAPRSRDIEVTFRVMTRSGAVSESVRVIESAQYAQDTSAVLPRALPRQHSIGQTATTIQQLRSPSGDVPGRIDYSVSRPGPNSSLAVQSNDVLTNRMTTTAHSEPKFQVRGRSFENPENGNVTPASGESGAEVARSQREQPPSSPQPAFELRTEVPAGPPPSPPQPPRDQLPSTGQELVQSQTRVQSAPSANELITDKIASLAPSATPVSASTLVITPPVLKSKASLNPLPAALWQLVKPHTVMELKLMIDDKGRITQIQPAGSHVFAKLVTSFVQRDVSRWRYEPARLNGKPVPSEQTVILNLRPGRN